MPKTNPGHNGPPTLHNVIPEHTLNRVKRGYKGLIVVFKSVKNQMYGKGSLANILFLMDSYFFTTPCISFAPSGSRIMILHTWNVKIHKYLRFH